MPGAHDDVRTPQASAHGDEKAEARVRCQKLGSDEIGPAVGQGELQGAKDHGKSRGDAQLAEDLPVAGSVGTGHLYEDRACHAHAHVGVDDAGHNAGYPDDEDLAGQAYAKPEHRERDPGYGRNGADELEHGAEQALNQPMASPRGMPTSRESR